MDNSPGHGYGCLRGAAQRAGTVGRHPRRGTSRHPGWYLYLGRQDAWAQREIEERARGTQAEIGYIIAPEFTGRGYASEAVAELVRICFEELGVRRVVAACFADNTASWRVMEKVGMRREGRSRQASLHRSGRWLDELRYAILADEWRAIPAAQPRQQ